MSGDDGFELGPKETVAGALITSSVSGYILQSNLPIIDLVSEYELTLWALGGVVTAMAVMVLWVRQTNQGQGQSQSEGL